MTQIATGRVGAKALFEAGDRPTDQNFTDLFDSILFLGESNPNSNGDTSMVGNLSVDGSLTTTGAFIVNVTSTQAHVLLGKNSGDETLDKPLQVYGSNDKTIIFASGSVSNNMFEGVSGDATSSIKLSDDINNVRFGTHTGKAFIEVAGNEILNVSSSNGTHTNRVYVSGSLGIGTTSPSQGLHVVDAGVITSEFESSDNVQSLIEVSNNAGLDVFFGVYSGNLVLKHDDYTANHFTMDSSGNVGIGTSTPPEKLTVEGNISASGTATFGTSTVTINGPAGHITASGNISASGDIIGVTGSFDHLKADTVSGSHIGDGSGLTGISSTQIALFGGDITENNLTTINSAGTGIDGEANLTFDGDDLKLKGAISIATGSAALFTPDAPLHIKHTGDSLGSVDLVHLSMNSSTAEGDIGIKFSDHGDVANQHFRIVFEEGNVNALKFNSDQTSNILYLKNTGLVGIGTDNPDEKLTVKDGNILVSGSGYMQIGVNQTDSGEIQMGVTSGTAEGFLKVTNNATFAPSFKLVQESNTMLKVSQSKLTVFDNEGTAGIHLRSRDNVVGSLSGSFLGESDVKEHQIYFPQADGSNDPGMIVHESRGTTDINQAVLHLCPSDDNVVNDYVAIHGYNDPIKNIIDTAGNAYFGSTVLIGDNASYGGAATNALHINVSNTQVGTTHDQNIGILIENQGGGDAGIEFEVDTGQYFSMFLDQSQEDLLIRDITNSRTLAQFTDAGNIVLGHAGDVYGRYENQKATTLYRFHGLYLTWDSDSYGTNYNHSITSTLGTEATNGYGSDDITINSYGSILVNIDSNDNGTEKFKIGHKTTADDNILWEIDETGQIEQVNGINITDTTQYWLTTANNWGLYWNTTDNLLEFHGSGTRRGYIDLDNGNFLVNGWGYFDYIRLVTAPGGATSGEVRMGIDGSGNNAGSMKLQTEHGFVKIGPQNSSYSHFYTDRAQYFFNKKLVIDENEIQSHDGDLILRRQTGNDYVKVLADSIQFEVNGNTEVEIKASDMLLGGKIAFEWNDNWLRINDGSTFSNGIYTGTSLIRTDSSNGIRVGSNSANKFFAGGGRVGINQTNGVVYNTTYNTMIMKMVSQFAGFAIQNNDNDNYWNNWYGHGNSDVTFGSSANQLIWSHNGAGQNGGWIQSTTSGVNQMFTGQHRNIPAVGEVTDYMTKIGYIVSSNGTIQNVPSEEASTHEVNRPNINESLPRVKLSDVAQDKKVYGVISELEDPDSTSRAFMHGNFGSLVNKNEGDDRLIINSVGEGAIMVCNINGNLENGDYITTSEIPGIGMKQNDDLLHNYTVAKIVQDCNFTQNKQYIVGSITHNGVVYKTALVGCTYHCG